MAFKWPEAKDPEDVSWWEVDAASFLDGDTISTATFTAPSGITKVTEGNTTTTARIKVSGGTAGISYTFGLTITTAGGQTFQRDCVLKIKDQ